MRLCVSVSLLVGILCFPGVSGAKESAAGLIEKAKNQVEAGDVDLAATALAQAVATAQKEKDLEAEVEACERLEDLLEAPLRAVLKHLRNREKKSSSSNDAASTYQALLLRIMKELDPKRLGAIASAPALARCILGQATQTGDLTGVAEAAAVLKKHLTNKRAGTVGVAMAHYASGMLEAIKKDHAAAFLALRRALDMAADAGWSELTVLIGTEAAAAAVASGDNAAAKKALGDVVPVLKHRPYLLTHLWKGLVEKRLEHAPEDVRAPAQAFFDANKKPGGMAGAAGGKGGTGGRGGKSVFGEAYKSMKKNKPFVSVTRTESGMSLAQHFGPGRSHNQPRDPMVKHWAEDGVTVSFFHESVNLRMIDMKGGRGGRGERSHASHVWAFVPLAVGETWAVTKGGTATISAKKRRR